MGLEHNVRSTLFDHKSVYVCVSLCLCGCVFMIMFNTTACPPMYLSGSSSVQYRVNLLAHLLANMLHAVQLFFFVIVLE